MKIDKSKIQALFDEYFYIWSGSAHVDREGLVHAAGSVQLKKDLPNGRLPIAFHMAKDWSNNDHPLSSLEGCPVMVTGDFNVSGSKLDNLMGGPRIVGGNYDARQCSLASAEGAPTLAKTLNLDQNQLPKIGRAHG